MSTHDETGSTVDGPEVSAADSEALSEALAEDVIAEGSHQAAEGPEASDDDVDALLAELSKGSGHEGPAPWQDPAVEAAMSGGAPVWLGMRWREIPADQQRDALVGLRRWVDWLVAEFDFPRQVIPACWYRHPNVIAELHAAMNMEYKVWEEGAPTANPMMMWLPHLQAAEGRLRSMVENLQCDEHGHVETETRTLNYDEELWRATVYTQHVDREIDRPDTGDEPVFVRARVVDEDGQLLDTSQVAQVAAVSGTGNPDVTLSGERVSGAEAMTLHAHGVGMSRQAQIVWESAESPSGPWSDLDSVTGDGESEDGDE